MKIDPGVKQVSLPGTVENRPAQGKGTPTPAEQTGVSLSKRAAQLQALEAQLAAITVVDRAKVDAIKEAIAGGQYSINPDNVAQNLVESVKEMLHVSKPR